MNNAPTKQNILCADNDENCANVIKNFHANLRRHFYRGHLCAVAAQKKLACAKDLRDYIRGFHPGGEVNTPRPAPACDINHYDLI